MANRRQPDRGPKPLDTGRKSPDKGPKPPQPSPDTKRDSSPDAKKNPAETGGVMSLSSEAVGAIKNLLGPEAENFDATLAELKSTQLDLETLKKFRDRFTFLQKQAREALDILQKDLSAIVLDEELKTLLEGTSSTGQTQALEKAIKELGKVVIGLDLRIETKESEEESQREREIDKKNREEFCVGLERSFTSPQDLLMALNEIDRSSVTEFLIKKSGEKNFSDSVKQLVEQAHRYYEEDLAGIQRDRESFRQKFVPSEQLAKWEEVLKNPAQVELLKKRGAYEKALEKVAAQFEKEFEVFQGTKEAEFAGFEEAALNQRNEEIARAVAEEISLDDLAEILKTQDFHLGAVADKLAEIYHNKKDKKDILTARSSLHTPREVIAGLLDRFSDRSIERIAHLRLGVFYTEAFGQELEKRGMLSPNEAQDKLVRQYVARKIQIIHQKFIEVPAEAAEINNRAKTLQEGPESLEKIQADFDKTLDITQLEALLHRVDAFKIQAQQLVSQREQKVTDVKNLFLDLPPIPEVTAVLLEDVEDYKNSLEVSTTHSIQIAYSLDSVKRKIEQKLASLKDAESGKKKVQRERQVGTMFEMRDRFQTVQNELSSLQTDLHSLETRIHHNKEILAQIAEARTFNLEADISLFHGAPLHEVTLDNGILVHMSGTRNERKKIAEKMDEIEKTMKKETKELESQIEARIKKFEVVLSPLSAELQSALAQLEQKGIPSQEREAFKDHAETLINQFKGSLQRIYSHEKASLSALHKKFTLMMEMSKGGKEKAIKQEELRKLEQAEHADLRRLNQYLIVDFQNSPEAQRKAIVEELASQLHHVQEAIDRLHFVPPAQGTARLEISDLTPSHTTEDQMRVELERRRTDLEKDFKENLKGIQSEVEKFEKLGEETRDELENYKKVLKDIETVRKSNVMVEFSLFGTAPLREATVDEGIITHKKGNKELRRTLGSKMEDLAKGIKEKLGKSGVAAQFENERLQIQEKVNHISRELDRIINHMEALGVTKAEYQKFLNNARIDINILKARVAQVEIKEKEVKAPKPSGGHH